VTKVSDLRLLLVLAASRRTPRTDGCIRAVLQATKGVPIQGPRRLLLPLFPHSDHFGGLPSFTFTISLSLPVLRVRLTYLLATCSIGNSHAIAARRSPAGRY
jgi:hypothetical protein